MQNPVSREEDTPFRLIINNAWLITAAWHLFYLKRIFDTIATMKLIDLKNELPYCSVIIPCRNEDGFISNCLDSILTNDYPEDKLEIYIIDGMSEDGTRQILEEYTARYSNIKLLDNPKLITPAALNIGIKNSKGDIIIRMDAHARVERDYISRCVQSLIKNKANNVGGIMKTIPKNNGLLDKAIVSSLSHRFGIGNSYFRINTQKPTWVDTVFGGCYSREVFNQVGLFNENLSRGQDMEFNLRLKKAGGRTLLVPDIVSYYYARSDLRSFLLHNWGNGIWAILPFAYSDIMPVSWRHLVPLGFVSSLCITALLGIYSASYVWGFLILVAIYSLSSLSASFHIAWRERDPRYLILMPFVFGMLHISYGSGSCWGVVKLVTSATFWNKLFRVEVKHG